MEKEPAQGLELLREPFPPHQISLLPKPTKKENPKGKCAECGGWHGLPAVHLNYVGHAALTDRLLDADPGWTWEPLALSPDGLPVMDVYGGMWIRLTVCGVTRLGYGDAQGKSGGDAVKEVIGDALRNAAMRFGAALDLWHKGDLHGPDDDGKDAERAEQRAKWLADWLAAIDTAATTGELKQHVKTALEQARREGDVDAAARIDAAACAKAAKAKRPATTKAPEPAPASERGFRGVDGARTREVDEAEQDADIPF